jgi:hypothetical protein
MKSPRSLLSTFIAGALLFTGTAIAQEAPAAASTTMSPAGASTVSATYQTPQGTLVVNSLPAKIPSYGPAPAFEQLADGGKAISSDQAAAYPPLANDFLHADRNKDGTISKAEYTHWAKQL